MAATMEGAPMLKLLVPLDKSDSALRALQYAMGLARASDSAALHIVTAHEGAIENMRALAFMHLDEIEKGLNRQSEDILTPALDLVKASGVPFTSEILTGDIAKAIVASADRHGCTGIVMGSRGMTAVANLVLGSVATKVIHLTKLPVTVVK